MTAPTLTPPPVTPPPVTPPPVTPPPGVPTEPTPRPDRGPLIQRLLLGAGALCVLVAGSVFLAVSWDRLGAVWQAGIALAVTALAAVAAHLCRVRGLRASAETLALVTAGLLALDLTGAHRLDVLGAGSLPLWTWLTVATGLVAVVTGALAALDRLSVYGAATTAAAGALPFTALAALHDAGFDLLAGVDTAIGLVVAAVAAVGAVTAARRDVVVTVTAGVVSAVWWCLAIASAAYALSESDVSGAVAGAAWTVTAAVALVLTGRVIAAGRTRDDVSVFASVLLPIAVLPAPLVAAIAAARLGDVAVIVLAALVALPCALPWATRPAGLPAAAGALATGVLLPPASLVAGLGTDLAAAVLLVLAGAFAGLLVHGRGALRTAAGIGIVVAVFGAVGLAAVARPDSTLWLASGWTALAAALIVAAGFRPAQATALFGTGSAVAACALAAGVAGQSLDARSPALVIALLGLGAACTGLGVVVVSRAHLLVGASGIALAVLDLAAIARVEAVEAYTLPVAGVLALAGLLGRVARPGLSSWASTAPALLVALVPSTVVALGDPGVARLVGVGIAAGVVAAAGARFRLAAPLVIGALTEAALALSQLGPVATGAPRWLTLALAGVLLLTLGVLFESARRGARAAAGWYSSLH